MALDLSESWCPLEPPTSDVPSDLETKLMEEAMELKL